MATATPPIGVPPTSAAIAPSAPPRPVVASSRPPPRPVVPAFAFAPSPGLGGAATPADTIACAVCGQPNQRGLRFCVSCGKSLAPQPAPAPAAAAAPPTQTPAAPPPTRALLQTHTMQDAPVRPPLTPARVVGVGAADAPKAAFRVCPRCRGSCDAAAQFCRFCGASLSAEARPAAVETIAPPVAQALTTTVPSSGPTTDPAPPPAMSGVDGVHSSAPVTPPIDENHYRAYQAMSAAASPSAHAAQATPGASSARIVLIARDGGEGAKFALGETTDIGRHEGQVLLAEDRYVAPRHARLAWRGDTLYLRDLDTPNGLYLRLAPHHDTARAAAGGRAGAPTPVAASTMSGGAEISVPLRDQDLFLVGQQVLRFEVVNDAVEGFGAASQHGTLVFGTPAAPRYARLSQRTVEGVTRDVFYLHKVETVLGRELGDIVFTEDPFLSRRHAALRVDTASRSFSLVDLGSSNGTFLRIRDEVALRNGDQFRIGQQLFRVDVDAAVRS